TLAEHGERVCVVDPRWVLPYSGTLLGLVDDAARMIHIEDGLVSGGIGAGLREALVQRGANIPVHIFGIPHAFHETATRAQLVEDFGLTASAIIDAVSQ
ncbi:MAG: transketolase C-terminal domain-containing protein, partial [Bowdeniella nasicola]|nr:transketolase C-terminal domain-containing protein [Bowdeniella nasicola]